MSRVRSKVLDDVRRLVASGGLPPESVLAAITDGLIDLDDELKGSRDSYDKETRANVMPLMKYLVAVERRVERWMRGDIRNL
jgi:hypothetical protein